MVFERFTRKDVPIICYKYLPLKQPIITRMKLLFSLCLLCTTIAANAQVELITQSRSNGAITWITYNQQGNYIASANAGDNDIRVWDVRSGKIVGTLTGHDALITSLKFIASGDEIISADKDGRILIWNMNTWTVKDSLDTDLNITTIVSNGNGQLFAGSKEGKLLVMDDKTFTPEKEISVAKNPVTKMAINTAGDQIAIGTKTGEVVLFDVKGRKKTGNFTFHKGAITGLAYKDNTTLISGGTDGLIVLANTADKKKISETKAHDKAITTIDINTRSGYVVTTSADKKIKLWKADDLSAYHTFENDVEAQSEDEAVQALEFSPDGYTFASSGFRISPFGKQKSDNTIKIWSVNNKQLFKEMQGTVKPILSFCFYPLQNKIALLHDGNELSFWDFDRGEKTGSFQLPEAKREYHPTIKNIKENATNNVGENIKGIGNLGKGNFSLKDNDLVKNAGKKVKNQVTKVVDNDPHIMYSTNGNFLVTRLPKDEIRVYSVKNDSLVYKHYIKHELEKVNCTAISTDEKTVACGGVGAQYLSLVDLETGEFKQHIELKIPEATQKIAEITALSYSPDGKYLAVVFNTGKLFLLDATSSSQVYENIAPVTLSALKGGYVNFTRDSKYILYNGINGFQKVNISGFGDEANEKLKIKGHMRHMDYPQDFALSVSHSGLHIYHLLTQQSAEVPCRYKEITHVGVSASGRIAMSFRSGELRIYDPSTAKNIATMVTEGENAIIKTNENYYKVNKEGYSLVTFRVGKNAYPFEQFDLYFNRPAKVLEALGSKETELVKLYASTFDKRQKKMGASGGNIVIEALPEINIANRSEIPVTTGEKSLKLRLKATDKNTSIKTLQVWLNNVPVYGQKGLKVKASANVDTTLTIPLINGVNEIRCAAINQSGNESLNEAVRIDVNYNVTPNLYLVCIGTSLYKEKKFSLKYAAKDARDLAALFKAQGAYGNVYTKTLTDVEVNKKNIQSVKDFLAGADVNDVVLIFVAGHGVLDADFNYFYAGHTMAFSQPAKEGIPYEMLESLVEGIKAIKKILIMDTCHSGEVDKDDVKSDNTAAVKTENVAFRAAGEGAAFKDEKTAGASKMMRELFADLRKGTGATAISSAGGTELAMESDTWKNGLFTYCLLSGLKDKTADLDKNGNITLHELQTYLVKEVAKRSNGEQVPTTRVDNFMFDYRVW